MIPKGERERRWLHHWEPDITVYQTTNSLQHKSLTSREGGSLQRPSWAVPKNSLMRIYGKISGKGLHNVDLEGDECHLSLKWTIITQTELFSSSWGCSFLTNTVTQKCWEGTKGEQKFSSRNSGNVQVGRIIKSSNINSFIIYHLNFTQLHQYLVLHTHSRLTTQMV